MINSAYIHIPFCQQICHYCDFTKFFYNEKLATDYVRALANEITVAIPEDKKKMNTIYIGGGTPTALNMEQLTNLMKIVDKKFDVANCPEYTIEANPGDFDSEKIKLLKSYGVNRISLGVQVFDDKMLAELGRVHTVKDVYITIDELFKHGFTNISIDLIYSLPNQTVEHFEKTLNQALSFNLPHYSTYSLQIEPKTVFFIRHKKGKLHRPLPEDEVAMYELLRNSMRKNGVRQYEISNFAKPGYESKHNLTYWNNDYYYGFGAGASGYLPGKRTINLRPLPAYTKKAFEDGMPILRIEEIGLKEKIEEEMFLGLRKMQGVSNKKFSDKFGFSYKQLYKQVISELNRKGWVYADDDVIRLTDQGVLFGNNVFAEFLLDVDPSMFIDKKIKI